MSAQAKTGSVAERLSPQVRAAIDRWVAKYPPEQKSSAVMAALSIVQRENGGWLTSELMDAVAHYLQMPPIAVYEVASFYTLYDLKPVGRHKIYVCTNISCMLCGAQVIVGHLRKRLGIDFGQTTPDGRFTLKEAECLAACAGAPMFMIDDRYYEDLTPARVDEILAGLA